MALGPVVQSTTYVVVYNPSKYISSITDGQGAERLEALKHMIECITHSDVDLITLGSFWLCVTNLLINKEQRTILTIETRLCALKCILELIKNETLQQRSFNRWLSFDFLARYQIEAETDANIWLQCFYALTNNGKTLDRVDDRLRAHVLVQFIDGILTGPMSRINLAYQTLKELLTTNTCQFRYDELILLFEHIFHYLNRDDDDNSTSTHHHHRGCSNMLAPDKSLEFLEWLIDHNTLNTKLLHFFIRNIVNLHDKYKFSVKLNTELLQLITAHLTKTPSHSISLIAILCRMIFERLELPTNDDIDPLSTLLFVLTRVLIDIRQTRSTHHHVQISVDDVVHGECVTHKIRQMPLCWLTILHRILVKRENISMVLTQLQQFLTEIGLQKFQSTDRHAPNVNACALALFDMTVWKMMHAIMETSYKCLIDKQSTLATRTLYDHCLTIFEDLSIKMCCLPYTMMKDLFDIKRLISASRSELRQQMIEKSINQLLRLIRPDCFEWESALEQLIDHIILNTNESVASRKEVLKNVFKKFIWFKLTRKLLKFSEILLQTLAHLIHIDLNSITEHEFHTKHESMKQLAIEFIFKYFLFDHLIHEDIAEKCYQILEKVYQQDLKHLSSIESIHRPLIESILHQMCSLFNMHLIYSRLTPFKHCNFLFNFILNQVFETKFLQIKTRILIWQTLFNIRLRSSDMHFGWNSITAEIETVTYGVYKQSKNHDHRLTENESQIDLSGCLTEMVTWLKAESREVISGILVDLWHFLKEQTLVHLTNVNIEQLIVVLIDLIDHSEFNDQKSILNCLIVCTGYKSQLTQSICFIDCFLHVLNLNTNSTVIIQTIQGLLVSLYNLHDDIHSYLSKIILHLSTINQIYCQTSEVSQAIIEFLMHLAFQYDFHSILFDNNNNLLYHIFTILIHISKEYKSQTAHNLISVHTIICLYFNHLPIDYRQQFAYFVLRTLHEPLGTTRDIDPIVIERPARLQRSGSLSSLNDDLHGADAMRRKMTHLPLPPTMSTTTTTLAAATIVADDHNNHPMKKLNDEWIRITTSFIGDHLAPLILPTSILVRLPREIRRHHPNNCWLGDDTILYQVKSNHFKDSINSLNLAKELLAKISHDIDETIKSRYRRHTDGNVRGQLNNNDLQTGTIACQDDLHIRPLESDINRSMFAERKLWIAVTVRSFTSTKTFLAVNLAASLGMIDTKNERLHWFEAVKLTDTWSDKSVLTSSIEDIRSDWQHVQSINESVLNSELRSIIANIDHKDEENMLHRHNETLSLQAIHRVPSEARKPIADIDSIEPVRVAKIGVVYASSGQEMNEINILSNIRTSSRYKHFMSSLAELVAIKDLQQNNRYCPLLDANNSENCGEYAYFWQNSLYQVLFHASTVMPNTRADHEFKKKLIGNDCVMIVYNESDYSLEPKMLRSGVCLYYIELCPQIDSNYTRVRVKKRSTQTPSTIESNSIIDIDFLLIDDNVASYVRLLALCLSQQAELDSRQRAFPNLPFLVSSWQNRLQAFRKMHTHLLFSNNRH